MITKELIENIFPTKEEIPKEFVLEKIYHQKEYLIDGKICSWDGPMERVLSPICLKEKSQTIQQVIGSYPLMSKEYALMALDAATKAYDSGRGEWPTMSVSQRIKHTHLFLQKMRARRDEIVNLLMWEIGKSLNDSRKEFDRTIVYIEETIEALKELDRNSSRFVINSGILAQVRRAPLGVVLCMGPFNYPLNETFTTLIPALMMGNTVIFKPPKLGVLLHGPLLSAFKEAFPPGVVNVVYGDGQTVLTPIMESGKINCLAFIGSCKVADILKSKHPLPHRLKSILGLEAKNAGIVLADADIENAVKESVLGSLSYNGQRCTALKILFIEDKIKKDFYERFAQKVSALTIGMPWTPNVDITPLPEPNKSEYLNSLVQDAIAQGAKLINPLGGISNKTFFYPAVIADIQKGMQLYDCEQFGPIVAATSFSDIEEPIEYIVNSKYGQQASIFTKNADRLAHILDPLVNQVCRVNINTQCQRGPDIFPFTGRKDSAEGALSISDALKVFSIRTMVAAKYEKSGNDLIGDIIYNHKSKFLSTDFIL